MFLKINIYINTTVSNQHLISKKKMCKQRKHFSNTDDFEPMIPHAVVSKLT